MRPSVVGQRSFVILALAAASACGHGTSPSPTPLPCAYTVVASATSFNPAGGTGSVTVATTAGCTWSGRSEAAWLAITSATTGSGAGTLSFIVAANADPPVAPATLTVAEQTVTIEQEAAPIACTYTISPAGASIDKDGRAGAFSLATADACAWTAASDVEWLTLTGATAGTGEATIGFTVTRNERPDGPHGHDPRRRPGLHAHAGRRHRSVSVFGQPRRIRALHDSAGNGQPDRHSGRVPVDRGARARPGSASPGGVRAAGPER